MQVEDHAGYLPTDVWVRWLPAYEALTYNELRLLCRKATQHWMKQQRHAEDRHRAVKTDIARKRWHTRAEWCRANVSRWQNSLRDAMIHRGKLTRETVPF